MKKKKIKITDFLCYDKQKEESHLKASNYTDKNVEQAKDPNKQTSKTSRFLTSADRSFSMTAFRALHSSSSACVSLRRFSLSEMCRASISRISAAWSSCICTIFSSYSPITSSISSLVADLFSWLRSDI